MKVGSFPKGASPFGVLDMAGNVWEWTSTTIAPHPRGFDDLNSAYGRVIKGGSCLNTKQVQRPAVRMYLDGGEMNTAIGFRCAKSERAGVDRLYHAYEDLRPGFPAGSPTLEVFRDTIAVENARYDSATGWPMGAESIGFCPIPTIPATDPKRLVRLAEQTDKLKSEILLGVFHTHRVIENLGLPAGDYAIYFQARDSKAFEAWQREQEEKAAEEAEAKKAEEEGKKPADEGSEDGKDEKKSGKKEAPQEGKKEKGAAAEAGRADEEKAAIQEEEEDADEGLPPFTTTDRLLFKDRRGIVRAEIRSPEITQEDSVLSGLDRSGLDMTIRMVIRPEFGTKMLQIRIPLRLAKPL
jgi:hypothetical protein